MGIRGVFGFCDFGRGFFFLVLGILVYFLEFNIVSEVTVIVRR